MHIHRENQYGKLKLKFKFVLACSVSFCLAHFNIERCMSDFSKSDMFRRWMTVLCNYVNDDIIFIFGWTISLTPG